MEQLERVELLADPDKFERLAGNGANREGSTAACVAVHLGEYDTGDAEPLVKLVSALDGVLSGHSIGDKQDLGWMQRFLELLQLGHQIIVDMQASRGIDQDHVAPCLHRFAACALGQIERFGFFRCTGVKRQLEVARNNGELVPGGGTVN